MQNKRYHHGFTIVEMLIALAITAILLTAIAVAFNASIINFTENQNIFKAINSARQALSRITTQVRTAKMVDANDISGETRCRVWCADGSIVTYRYENSEQKLYLDTSDVDHHLLCDNVAAMTFKKDYDAPTGGVKSVQISMTVVSGDVRQTVSAAAVVRRVLN